MFERLSDRARRALVLAQDEARRLNHSFIGTEHLLLGLLHEGEGVAAKALESLGVPLESARRSVEATVGRGSTAPSGSPPFTPRMKKVLELSLSEAVGHGQEHVGTEHLLLGLVSEGEGVGAQTLVNLTGHSLPRVRHRVIEFMHREPSEPLVVRPEIMETRAAHVLRQRMARERPPWLRCALCGRSLWETAQLVVGEDGRACEECIRAAADMLEQASRDQRELELAPRVSGQPPDVSEATAIVAAIQGALGPGAGPSTWQTTVEDHQLFVPFLQHAEQRAGRWEIHVAEVGFVSSHLAYARFQIRFASGSETTISGLLRLHDGRWRLTEQTLTETLRRIWVHTEDQPVEPAIEGVPPDDRAVEGVTAAIASVFGSEHQPGGFADRLEDAEALVPHLWQARVRLLGMLNRRWVARVQLIRFTSSETADVHFAVEPAAAGPSFPAVMRRHGDRWMVTRNTMVAILPPGEIDAPPGSEDD